MERKIEFTGSGGSLFVKFLVGGILTGITLGIYLPWFVVNLEKYIMENLTLKTESGDVKFQFTGSGGSLFVTYLVGMLLTMITIGIYAPWFMVKLTNWMAANTKATAANGSIYNVKFNGGGGSLFGTYLLGVILTSITFGICAPWFMVNLAKFFLNNMDILENGAKAGAFSFTGEGAELLGTYIVGAILTSITFGIYGAWFAVSLMKYFAKGTGVSIQGKNMTCKFVGEGASYFGLNFVGILLTMITFGIYAAWYTCNLMKFQFENLRILDRT
ncbi:MAG TPA: DUF898 family protein [Candidatus Syntrophosphaera sp.]|nr:DUF898 family protein [Candidatus Syntrophosphaera sp.]